MAKQLNILDEAEEEKTSAFSISRQIIDEVLTSDGTYTYTYDIENRLTRKTTGSGNTARTTNYTYDSAGNLIKFSC